MREMVGSDLGERVWLILHLGTAIFCPRTCVIVGMLHKYINEDRVRRNDRMALVYV
jgi:hypothetical protein